MVAIDVSPESRTVFNFAKNLVRFDNLPSTASSLTSHVLPVTKARQPGNKLIILSVVELLPRTIINSIRVDFDYQLLDKANDHREHDAARLVKEYQDICKQEGVAFASQMQFLPHF